jgi:BirA family biotin operon repressor/biotin-[acetyl-CoA-carboxylase] ligase
MQTLFIGQNLIELASVDSTNNYVLEMLKKADVAEGALVWAKEQTGGRGQRGNTWLSEPHRNLTFSFILLPHLPIENQFYLTKLVSLGIVDFVSGILSQNGISCEVRIKKPNDIYVNGQKISGILIENNIKGHDIVSSIIGIGLNVNQNEFKHVNNATSLSRISGKNFDLKDCLTNLCEYIEARYLQLKTNKIELLDKDYEERSGIFPDHLKR